MKGMVPWSILGKSLVVQSECGLYYFYFTALGAFEKGLLPRSNSRSDSHGIEAYSPRAQLHDWRL